MERYIRNFTSISEEQQEILSKANIAIVGLGGLGGYVLENLVRLGVKKFNLIDMDVFDESNLNRQILSTEENLGESKVKEALKRAKSIDHQVTGKIFKIKLDEFSYDLVEGVDLVIDCLDSIEGKKSLENLCDKMELSLVHGAIRGYYGQAGISLKDDRILDKVYKNVKTDNISLGNLPMTCMITASIQVALGLKILFDEFIERELVVIDVKEMEIDRIKL